MRKICAVELNRFSTSLNERPWYSISLSPINLKSSKLLACCLGCNKLFFFLKQMVYCLEALISVFREVYKCLLFAVLKFQNIGLQSWKSSNTVK